MVGVPSAGGASVCGFADGFASAVASQVGFCLFATHGVSFVVAGRRQVVPSARLFPRGLTDGLVDRGSFILPLPYGRYV